MRIGVNARFLNSNKSDGISRYSYETLKRLTIQHPEHEFIFFFDRRYAPELVFAENVTPIVIGFPARHPVLWYLWFECSMAKALKKYRADIFFSPDGFMPLSTSVPSLIVIHDINFFHRPEDLPVLSGMYYNYFYPRFARKAEMISTVSEFSKNDIASAYNIEPSKILVHYNGTNDDFKPATEQQQKRVRKKFTGGVPYFIFIGNIHPRKNLINLLRGFNQFRQGTDKEFRLVIAGKKLFGNNELNRFYHSMVYRKDVIFTGHIEADQLQELLASAEALTFFPFYEGFGLPVLEAMLCDVPVITSGVTSLPEVAGNAAIYADPSDHLSISDAMKLVVFSPRIKNELIENGRMQREKFNWDITASGLWQTMKFLYRNA